MTRLIDAEQAEKVLGEYYHIKTETQHRALREALDRVQTIEPSGLTGWICPICGRGLSPFTYVCPCQGGKGWEITCG